MTLMMTGRKRRLCKVGIVLATMLLMLCGCQSANGSNPAKEPAYWPTDGWKTSTPEEQGMDSTKLAEMYETIDTFNYEFHHILVIRNGYVVSEADYYPYQKNDLHNVFSITKGITSALTGIAIEEGFLKGTDDTVASYLPNFTKENASDYKSKVTIENLLTMSSGLEWSETGDYTASTDSNTQMWQSKNQLQYVMALPVTEEPGKRFNYSTGSTHLLGSVVAEATKMSLEAYAKERIWTTLGISNVFWGKDNQGNSVGGSRSLYTAEDLAKIGYLYLNMGKWGDKQLIPSEWIEKSTQKILDTPNGPAGRDGYGYQWWMNPFGGYSARGYGGQFLYVLPKQNMVVVMFGSMNGGNYFKPDGLVKDYLIPACISEKEILESKAGNEALSVAMDEIRKPPQTEAVQALPDAVLKTNHKVFDLENNEKIGIDFIAGNDTAQLHWLTDGVQYDVPVGLDNQYRFSKCQDFYIKGRLSDVGYKGKWLDDTTFRIDIRPLESDCNYFLTLTFNADGIQTQFEPN